MVQWSLKANISSKIKFKKKNISHDVWTLNTSRFFILSENIFEKRVTIILPEN